MKFEPQREKASMPMWFRLQLAGVFQGLQGPPVFASQRPITAIGGIRAITAGQVEGQIVDGDFLLVGVEARQAEAESQAGHLLNKLIVGLARKVVRGCSGVHDIAVP